MVRRSLGAALWTLVGLLAVFLGALMGGVLYLVSNRERRKALFRDLVKSLLSTYKKKLDLLELEGYPKTTGGDGLHVYIPIEPVYTYEEARTFAELIARLVIAERPEMFTTPRSVSK